MSFPAFAQDDIPVKTDGTKYYLQIYDGETNEKVLQYENPAGWQYMIFTGDYFDGSAKQLWSFEATEMYPGYFSIVNHEFGNTHHLMSYNWYAYFTDAANRDPRSDKEMQFKFVKVTDEYYKLVTIEKPTDGSLYGINYTPGADALNVDENGQADFGDVKSDDITPENMVNMVFKVIEFNPIALYEESIVRGDELYNSNPNAPEKARYDLFYILEKAREIRVFGTDGEMLNFQTHIDSVVNLFNQSVGLVTVVNDARAFIDTTNVDDEVKASFNALINDAEQFLNSDDLVYDEIGSVETKINNARKVVEAIFAAQTYGETLAEQDAALSSGLMVSMDTAKAVLANDTAGVSDYTFAIEHLTSTQGIITEIIAANELIDATQEFQEAKDALLLVIQNITAVINSSGNSIADLDAALAEMQDAIKVFQKALEAGDTPIELKNAGFDSDLADWIVESPTPEAAYGQNRGIDGSRSITWWKGADYQMKVYQSISNIPNGTYNISCVYRNSSEGTIGLFAESGANVVDLPLPLYNNGEQDLTKAEIEVAVTDGTLRFGIRGQGENNGVPAGNWIIFDEFEVKLSADVAIKNAGFDSDLADWIVESPTPEAAYAQDRGIDASRSITWWNGADYQMKFYQTISNMPNGTYKVSCVYRNSADSTIGLFAESGTNVVDLPLTLYNNGEQDLKKAQIVVAVSNGTLSFGVRGQGENNGVPAGNWIIFDEFEVTRMPDVPVVNGGFDADLANWLVESPTPEAAYAQNRGIDASRSITWWRGSDYQMKFYQSMSNMLNGTYKISCVYRNSAEGTIGLFAESGANVVDLPLPLYNNGEQDLSKAEIEVAVTDGALDFGMRGQGDDNGVPAGNWIIYDEFQILIKSITPVYEVVEPTPSQMFVTDVQTQKFDNEIKYWQNNQRLNIQSNEEIVNYQVYSITGALVDQKETRTTTLSIPMRKGIFIVRVLTENGFIDTEKVIVN
ncbi:hypothetical protein LH29_15205 [Draconibacterium sediminis]|uniref:Uncharacterized protein n=2 Tax=Draconibacterium sediminis TaxID=1544798 RepID=A0A0D8JCL5_9BACT|nr:hypothetical protein LH29_15205 [Draconibacterium sediminis]